MTMQSELANNPTGILSVLSVSPIEEDHRCLQAIIGHSMRTLFKAENVQSALAVLQEHDISVIVCERDLMSGTWVDVLDEVRHTPHSPKMIVASRLADDRLWAEALNLGAWDVLAKPFDRSEVLRSMKTAGLHWHHQIQMPAMSMKLMSAAG